MPAIELSNDELALLVTLIGTAPDDPQSSSYIEYEHLNVRLRSIFNYQLWSDQAREEELPHLPYLGMLPSDDREL
jgi:hypothetical protein